MPAHGDQHKSNGAATHNPFEEVKPQISEYTAQEIATLQSRLNKRLGPEYISTRPGPGNSRVAYLPAEKAINLANEVFGFNGWSSSIQNIQIDFVDENATKGTISLGLSVVVRVTLRDGTYHEDTGYGGIENCKSKIAAFEKAKKEGTTDALKRALKNFGNVLGNCIYDKEYITKVSKIKAGQGRFDVNQLHRHADFKKEEVEEEQKKSTSNAPVQQQQMPNLVPEDSFDVNEFDAVDFDDLNPDEVPISNMNHGQQRGGQYAGKPVQISNITPSKPPQPRPDQQQRQPPHAGPSNHGDAAATRQASHQRQNQLNHNQPETNPQSRSSSPGVASQHFNPPQAPPGPQSIGFFSARAAEALDGNNNPTDPTAVAVFNPYAESPSIRKTSGIDHSKSIALNRNTLKPEPLVPTDDPAPKVAVEQARKVGLPGSAGPGISPNVGRMTTSAYRPPTRHGPVSAPSNGADRALAAAKRAPLSDLSNVSHSNGHTPEYNDAKRQRIGPRLSGHTDSTNLAPG